MPGEHRCSEAPKIHETNRRVAFVEVASVGVAGSGQRNAYTHQLDGWVRPNLRRPADKASSTGLVSAVGGDGRQPLPPTGEL